MCGTRTYSAWCNMMTRCFNPKSERWERYGGRGISVCHKWLNFQGFFDDMGECPSAEHTIDRKDNDVSYCKDNCQWSESEAQMSNTSRSRFYEKDGIQLTLSQWARKLGIGRQTIHNRIAKGWPVELALTAQKRVPHQEFPNNGN